ncbi:restriction endonuclease subunit S [Legionella rowbothamii]|uniref:restriction endonuclease subunit S n=1 Tax=Legionella rowbothamii TaxID=96229 RepID=UPI0010559DAB|nr:restriction endonuclease subunit S [Legionella rowbothamii]MDP3268884.1 restriction endonuclease subunit S [Legionella sp.]
MRTIQQLLTDHLDIWTAAEIEKKSGRGRSGANSFNIYGIKKLRELILDLAVRGKLVPQDPNDEPVSELLKRIQENQNQLIIAGKIKKNMLVHPISDGEKPFNLPLGWEWVKLGVLTEKLTDGSHNPPKDAGCGLPMLSSQNINFGKIDFDSPSRFVSVEDFEIENRRTKVEYGDVLLTIVGSLGRPAVVPQDAPKFVLQRSVAVIRTELFNEFLCLQLSSPLCLNYYELHGKGTAQKGIYLGKLSEMPIAVPSLNEQHRIVEKVNQLMALCDQLESKQNNALEAHEKLVNHLLNTLIQSQSAEDFNENWRRLAAYFDILFTTESSINALKQTLLHLAMMGKLVPQDPNDEPASTLIKNIKAEKAKLLTKSKINKEKLPSLISNVKRQFELPIGWELIRLDEISQVGTGATPLRTKPEYFTPKVISWVTSGETSNPYVYETEQYVSPLALKETNLTVYPKGTLIVAMYGQGKTRGQITELMIEACTNQACAAIRLFNTDEFHRKYVKLYFEKIYDEIRELAAGGAQPNLNLSKVKETLLPLPPLQEQYRIVVKIDALFALCDQLIIRITTAKQLQKELADMIVEQVVAS